MIIGGSRAESHDGILEQYNVSEKQNEEIQSLCRSVKISGYDPWSNGGGRKDSGRGVKSRNIFAYKQQAQGIFEEGRITVALHTPILGDQKHSLWSTQAERKKHLVDSTCH